MALVKIGPKHQITIPKQVFQELQLEVGDYLEVEIKNGKGVLTPKKLTDKVAAPKLTPGEQRLLESAKKKIQAIREDLKNSKGLTRAEARVAAKVGLIDPEQMYWWLESWQKGEREVERELEAGEYKEFSSAEEFMKDLTS